VGGLLPAMTSVTWNSREGLLWCFQFAVYDCNGFRVGYTSVTEEINIHKRPARVLLCMKLSPVVLRETWKTVQMLPMISGYAFCILVSCVCSSRSLIRSN
jgi:hypothetical protein